MQAGFVRAATAASGVFYALTGAALLFAPQWFYDNIGTFPPFNRHYEGDLGAFLLPLGIALMIAARTPAQHRLLIGLAAAGSLVHALNHLYDDVIAQTPLANVPGATLPLFVFAAVMGAAWVLAGNDTVDEGAVSRRGAV